MSNNIKEVNEALELAKAAIHHEHEAKFSASDLNEATKQAMIELNGGSSKLNPRTFRQGTALYAFVEELLTITSNEGLKGDEFFMQFVDYRNIAEGDQNIFYTEDQDGFIVSEIGRGNQAIRRQRLGAGSQVTITTTPKAIRVYEHLSRIMAGRVDFTMMVQRLVESQQAKKYEDIFALFSGITENTDGMYPELVASGTYSEDTLLDIIEHVEADANASATVIGTRKGLRQLKMDVVADAAKDDMYAMGYYGRFNGTPTYRIQSRYKKGTHEFIFPDNEIYVVASKDPFIKFVTEGQVLLQTRDAVDNNDLTQEQWAIEQYGLGLMISHGIGKYTIS